jgi:aspartate dehydrogenase
MSGFEASAPRLRLALIGWGAIARALGGLIASRAIPVEIVAVAVRDGNRARPDWPAGAPAVADPAVLIAMRPDVVMEAAGRKSVAAWIAPALAAGIDAVIASGSALTDDALRERLLAAARAGGARLHLPSGAVGALDVLSAARLQPLDRVTHEIIKPPAGWRGTAAETMVDLANLTVPTVIYAGSAREAAALFPSNANATVATALAGLGLDRTEVALVADPGAARNRHVISASGAFGEMTLTLDNAALPDNPRSSALTALSLARWLERRTDVLQIG